MHEILVKFDARRSGIETSTAGEQDFVPMADDSDPPRKFYGLKPREFVRVNPSPTPADEGSANSAPVQPYDPAVPIHVRDVIAAANAPGPGLVPGGAKRRRTAPVAPAKIDVRVMLAENVAREAAAGINRVSTQRDRRNRRTRDYVTLMVFTNVPLAFLAAYALRHHNTVMFVSSIAGIGLVSAGATWVMWFIVDKY